MVKCLRCGTQCKTNLCCSGCRLPDAYYCSHECQKKDWKRHKVHCRMTKKLGWEDDSAVCLKIGYGDGSDPTDVTDYDAALKFAKKYMPNIKKLMICLSREGLCRRAYRQADTAVIKLSYDVLKEYLESVPLESFCLDCDKGIQKSLWHATKDGKVFSPLLKSKTLQKFSIGNVFVKNMDMLPLTESLRYLSLREVSFSKWNGLDGWSDVDVEEMISRVTCLPKLEQLHLSSCPIEDDQLTRLLSPLKHLTHLSITGAFSTAFSYDTRVASRLTDIGGEIIARTCPKLKGLDLSFQRDISERTALMAVEKCPKLRSLELNGSTITPYQCEKIVSRSHALIWFLFGEHYTSYKSHEPELMAAMMASGGRTILSWGSSGRFEEDTGLTKREKKKMSRSLAIVEHMDDEYCY